MKKSILFTLLFLCAGTYHSTAQTLYGVEHNGPDGLSTLYSLDVATGAETLIGPVGFERCGGMDTHPTTGVTYCTCERADGSDTPVLITIDLATGAGTEVGPTINSSGSVGDISFRSDGVLFVYDGNNNPQHTLFTADLTTGMTTLLGSATIGFNGGNGIAFDPAQVLHHCNRDWFHTIDQATGAATQTVPTAFTVAGGSDRVSGMDYHPTTGIAYGIIKTSSGEFLATIDPATGTESVIAGPYAGIRFDALAFGAAGSPAAVPTMGEWGLIILALLVLSFGTVFMMRRQVAFAGTPNVNFSANSGIPFDKVNFVKMLAGAMVTLALVFAVAVLVFGYEMTNADVPGSLIAAPIAAYLLHLLFAKK